MRTNKKPYLPVEKGPKYEVLLLSLLALVVILIYNETLTSPFIFDDFSNIRDNPHIRLTSLNLKNIIRAAFQSPETLRPVANVSFALNYYFHGLNLVGFHLVNLLIHIFGGIFLYFFAKLTLKTPALRTRFGGCAWVPFFTAFIWLVHPLQTQSVAYLVQRMNSLAAVFYILSMLFYVKFRLNDGNRRKWPLLAGCVLAGLLAVGTKQIAATLPVFILLYEWYFFQGVSLKWCRRHIPLLGGIFLLMIILSLIYLGPDPIARILSAYSHRDFTLSQRVLTQFRVIFFYIGLLVWPQPSRLNLDHDFVLSYSLTDPPTTLISMMGIAAMIVLAVVTARREPLLSYGILWFLGNLVIESSVIGLELVFEHRIYLPSMFAIFAMVALALRYAKPTWPAAVVLCAAGILFTVWTFDRNEIWANDLSLYRDCAEKSPAKARPHNNLAAALLQRGLLPEAIEEFQTALKIKPDYTDAHYNLGNALVRQQKLKEAIYHFSEALRLRPRSVKILNNLGATFVLQGRFPEAVDCFEKALQINPADPDLHKNLGIAHERQGDLVGALEHFSKTLELDPENEAVRRNLVEIEKSIREAGEKEN